MADGLRTRIVDDALRSYLTALDKRLVDLTPVMTDIGAALEEAVRVRFDTKQDPSGQPWAQLSPVTRAIYARADRQRKRGGGTEVVSRGSLMIRTGQLREGVSFRATSSQVEIGFDRRYAGYHEFGTSRMPRRGLLTADPTTGALGDDDRRAVLDILQSYLSG